MTFIKSDTGMELQSTAVTVPVCLNVCDRPLGIGVCKTDPSNLEGHFFPLPF